MLGSLAVNRRSVIPASFSLRVLEVDADHGKALLANMVLVLWRKETKLAAFKRMEELILELGRAQPRGVGVLQVIEGGAVPPDSETKREFVKVLALGEGVIKHFSIVHENSGFSAAIVRAIMSGVYLFARPGFPHMVFSSIVESVAWHVQQQKALGPAPFNEAELMSAIHALRAQVIDFVETSETD